MSAMMNPQIDTIGTLGLILLFSSVTAAASQDSATDETRDFFNLQRTPLNSGQFTIADGVQLRAYARFLSHPYEVIIPNTNFGDFYFCQLFDAAGNVVLGVTANAGNGETRVYFAVKDDVASAACIEAANLPD